MLMFISRRYSHHYRRFPLGFPPTQVTQRSQVNLLLKMIDVEEENILKIIFKDEFPESWREDPDVSRYLRNLTSYGVEKINKEPELIAEEKANILEQTQDLVFNNYKTFIQTAECSKEIFQDASSHQFAILAYTGCFTRMLDACLNCYVSEKFNLIEWNLDSVADRLPVFIENCQKFSKKSHDINASRRLNSLTLSKHPHLLEILEMPQLMDTCVRNNYYDEALELAAYVFRLEKKYASIRIIQSIAEDVQESLKLMLSQLIQQLRTNIQLPACLKVIGYLRRMDVFTEEELRMKFLQARDSWFQSVLNGIPATNPYQHITKVIELSRVHLFDIMTQYRAIFAEDDPIFLSLKNNGHAKAAISHGWVMQKISQFLSILQQDLQKEMDGRLDSLLGQCMYFGLSFSRIGADFRSLLVPLFEAASLRTLKAAIENTTEKFESAMQTYVMTSPPTMLVSSVLAATTAAQDKLHPPLCLLEFPPLVELCNGILGALNEFRLLAPLSLVVDVTSAVQQCLEAAVKVIVDYHRTESTGFTAKEKEIFTKFCEHFAVELVPYMDRCLQAFFPQSQLVNILGVAPSRLAEIDYIGCIDAKTVLEPLVFILPEVEQLTRFADDGVLTETVTNVQQSDQKLDELPVPSDIVRNLEEVVTQDETEINLEHTDKTSEDQEMNGIASEDLQENQLDENLDFTIKAEENS